MPLQKIPQSLKITLQGLGPEFFLGYALGNLAGIIGVLIGATTPANLALILLIMNAILLIVSGKALKKIMARIRRIAKQEEE